MTFPKAETKRTTSWLLDTHVLLWLLSGDTRLGKKAEAVIEEAALSESVYISAITPWEIGMLAGKKRIDLHQDPVEWIRGALARLGASLVPLDPEVAIASSFLPFAMHTDPADRILVATSRHLGATLITADKSLFDLSKKGHIKGLDASR